MKNDCVHCFRLLSTPARFKIFEYLKKQPKTSISKLVKLTNLRQPTVTFHINQLVKKGLVQKTKVGRNVYCRACQKCQKCPLFYS